MAVFFLQGGSGALKGPVNGDCDFECGPCYWNSSVCDNFDWVVHEGGTDSWLTGPSADHTTGNKEGHVTYFLPGELDGVMRVCAWARFRTLHVYRCWKLDKHSIRG